MKINIEIDMTPEEAKELFVPSEKQAELGTQIYQGWLEAVHKNTIDLMNPANYTTGKNDER